MLRADAQTATRRILDQAIMDLRGAELSGPAEFVAQMALKYLKRRRRQEDVLADVILLEREMQLVGDVLARCRERLWEAEESQAASEPEGDTWWRHRLRRVSTAFDAGESDTFEAVGLWLVALEHAAWDWCDEVTSLPNHPRAFAAIRADMGEVTRALRMSTYENAVGPINRLLESGSLGDEAVAKLGLLATRIRLREGVDQSEVSAHADRTVDLVNDQRWTSLARTALAEAAFAQEGPGAARTILEAILKTYPPPVDALVLMGRVEEAEQQWPAADRLYEQAIAADDNVDRPALLRDVSPRLLVRYAARRGLPAERAARLLERALDEGVPGDGDYPDKDVWVSWGDRLVEWAAQVGITDSDLASGLRERAASAYAEAAVRYSSLGYFPGAVGLMEQACDLAPDDAELRWLYADTLRLDSYRPDGVIDRQRIEAAGNQFEAGLRLRRPGAPEVWVLLLQAAIEESLGDSIVDPALTLERAILLDPHNEEAYAFLANVLRRKGYIQEALEASTEGMGSVYSVEDFVFSTRLMLTLDLADYEMALELINERSLAAPDEQTLALERAGVELRQGRPEAALSQLDLAGDGEMARLQRALAEHALGHRDAAQAQFRALWLDTRSGPTYEMAGWAAFGTGLIDEAVELYRPLVAEAPDYLAYRRDLGLMLLVRGDVEQGAELLHEGIDRCPHPEELVYLSSIEVPYAEAEVQSMPHRSSVREALRAIEQHIEDRVATLRSQRRTLGAGPDGTAATAAAARTAANGGKWLDALDLYTSLAASTMPEAHVGALRAAASAATAADTAFHIGKVQEAIDDWGVIADRLTDLREPDALALRLSVHCRLMLSELLVGATPEPSDWWKQLSSLAEEGLVSAMAEARDVLAYDPQHLWMLRDGLLRLASAPEVSREAREVLAALVADLPVARTYGLLAARDDHVSRVFQAVSTPLEIYLGPAVAAVVTVADVEDRVARLRADVEQTMGVRIPWIHTQISSDLTATLVDYHVYGRPVAQVDVDGIDPDGWLGALSDGVDGVVKAHLGRLIGIDDVGLWLEGWDLDERDSQRWRLNDPELDRLRLARLLRMLVREGASVADRAAVVSGLTASSGSPKGGEPAHTLEALRHVRLRLGARSLGVVPGSRVVALPAVIESGVAEGLSADFAEFEIDRTAAQRLVADLRMWLATFSPRPDVIAVQHPGVRPFVWRLIPPEHGPLCVVTEEELA